MAISEICKFEVKKEIDECTANGMSRNEAAKWLAGIFSEALGRDVEPETIRKKDLRARNSLGTNVPSKKNKVKTDTSECIKQKSKDGTYRGGKREGAGTLSKQHLIIELNKKIGELHKKEEEYLELEKKNKQHIKNNPDLQASMMYGVILGAIRIIEKRIDLSVEEKTATFIPENKLIELCNRWEKVSLFINKKIAEVKK